MQDLSGSFSPADDLLEDVSSEDALSQEMLPKDFSPDEFPDEFPDENQLDNPFEVEEVSARSNQPDASSSVADGLAPDTIPQDLSPENSSIVEDSSTKEAPFEDGSAEDKPFKGRSSQEEDLESETETDSEPDIGRDIKKSLRTMMQWCDEVANRPDDIVTNFKSQLPFIIALAVIILLLWGLRLIYG